MASSGLWEGAEVRWVGPAQSFGQVSVRPGDRGVVVDPGRHRLPSFGVLSARERTGGGARRGVVVEWSSGGPVEVHRERLELVAPDHPLRLEPDASHADWFRSALTGWEGARLPVSSFVPRTFPAVARVLHPWRAERDDDVRLRWSEVAAFGGFDSLRALASIRSANDQLSVDGYAWNMGAGELDLATAGSLVDLLGEATATPDDVFFAVWVGWGDVPPQQFAGAAHFMTLDRSREHFLLRGPLTGALSPVGLGGRKPVSGMWWPADRSWFVATEVDFEWTFVAGSDAVVDQLITHSGLEATRSSFDNPANEPDEDLLDA